MFQAGYKKPSQIDLGECVGAGEGYSPPLLEKPVYVKIFVYFSKVQLTFSNTGLSMKKKKAYVLFLT